MDGNWCDIYQSKPIGDLGFWRRIWIDPSKELPVRVMGFRRGSNGEDEPDYEDTEIHANVDPPPELFSFEVPDGYEVTEVKEVPKGATHSADRQLRRGKPWRCRMDWTEYR